MKTKVLILLSLLGTFHWVPLTQAEVNVDISADIYLGRTPPPPPPTVVIVDPVGPPGPPPWAASHWYRRSYAYYYYPGYDVYYRPSDRMWFFLDGGSWRFGAQLPRSVHVDFGRAVPLSLEADRPYVYHEKIVTYYPPNYFSRVKFKDGGPRRDDHDDRPDRGRGGDRDDHRRDDDRDRDRGKGKGRDK